MRLEMKLPQFGMADNVATILQWRKTEGERVTEGEEVVEVETAKANVALEAPADGVLTSIVAGPGTECESGDVIAIIDL
jgi:pyruvate/2-oxoglutarate dehydrogenase complex dihydrolipoamide acyltransferase (E2) component